MKDPNGAGRDKVKVQLEDGSEAFRAVDFIEAGDFDHPPRCVPVVFGGEVVNWLPDGTPLIINMGGHA